MSRLLTIGVMQQARNIAGGGGDPGGPTPTPEQYFTTTDITGGCRITNYDTLGGLDVVIPQTIGGKQVLEISGGSSAPTDGAFQDKSLTSVVLPAGLRSINNGIFTHSKIRGAFFGNKLSSISIPASLEWIGSHAFRENVNFGFGVGLIESLVVPPESQLVEIGQYAFSWSGSPGGLTSLDLSNALLLVNIRDVAFIQNDIVHAILPAGITLGTHDTTLGGNGLRAAYLANDSLAGLYEYDSDTSTWDFTPEA